MVMVPPTQEAFTDGWKSSPSPFSATTLKRLLVSLKGWFKGDAKDELRSREELEVKMLKFAVNGFLSLAHSHPRGE